MKYIDFASMFIAVIIALPIAFLLLIWKIANEMVSMKYEEMKPDAVL